MTVNAPFGHRAGHPRPRQGPLSRLGRPGGRLRRLRRHPERAAADQPERGRRRPLLPHGPRRLAARPTTSGGRSRAGPTTSGSLTSARDRLDTSSTHLDDIHDVNEAGIRASMLAHRWGGATFHDSGWNPRHIEGVEHFFFYNLERLTGRHFIHGQPVGLGIYAGSVLQDNEPDAMLAALLRVGVDIRPEAMGVTWDDVAEAMRTLPAFVREAGLWFSVADAGPIGETSSAGPGGRRRRPTGHGRRRPSREDRHHAAAGLRPRVPRPGRARRPGQRTVEAARMGGGPRLRVALGLRPHAGRSAARGGADLRADRRARGARAATTRGPASAISSSPPPIGTPG